MFIERIHERSVKKIIFNGRNVNGYNAELSTLTITMVVTAFGSVDIIKNNTISLALSLSRPVLTQLGEKLYSNDNNSYYYFTVNQYGGSASVANPFLGQCSYAPTQTQTLTYKSTRVVHTCDT
jgi:hypothetical protein